LLCPNPNGAPGLLTFLNDEAEVGEVVGDAGIGGFITGAVAGRTGFTTGATAGAAGFTTGAVAGAGALTTGAVGGVVTGFAGISGLLIGAVTEVA